MASPPRKYSTGRKILIGIIVLVLIAGATFQIFIHRYLNPIVRERLEAIIVKGSDSLYTFDVGALDVSFWRRSLHFSGMHIRIDSNRYRILEQEDRLPPMTFDLNLPAGIVNGIGIRELLFKKEIDIGSIHFREANVQLARHFRKERKVDSAEVPLWKSIQPGIKSIRIGNATCDNLKMSYLNVDNDDKFRWQFDQCDVAFSGIRVDSASSYDSNRLLFAENIAINVKHIKMKTPDGMYNIAANQASYSSASRLMEFEDFSFHPAMSDRAFIRHYGYQHEIYKLNMPVIRLKNIFMPHWINHNALRADTIELISPKIAVSMDRNAKPNPHSKLGQYPHQLLQKAPFDINIRRLTAVDGTVTYTEKNNVNQLTGKLVFPSVRGYISNITNEPAAIKRSGTCVADVRSGVLNTGLLHAVFRFDLDSKAGAFAVNADISRLNAPQLQPLIKAMTSTDLQSFNMHQLTYSINGNERTGTGNLRMRYDDMDILINQVEPDKSFDKKGLLSFFANRVVIFKENPNDDEGERKAQNIAVKREPTKSFFNFVWKTLFTSAGEIVLRPMAQRKMEKRKERQLRREARKAARQKK